ncbi:MAG: hypothetical protein KC583_16810, partial [Myxococcales bacterium]|nr:hypothetical protein [Myxococcales bacterium]
PAPPPPAPPKAEPPKPPPPAAEPVFDPEADAERKFVEGELANVGAVGLVPWENRVGLRLGVERVGEQFYAAFTPTVNHTRELFDSKLSMSFGVPLRVEVFDARTDVRFDNAGRFRSEDWDDPRDYAQVIRAITFGGKEERRYIDINAFKASSIGHGTVMKRYNPHLDLNRPRVGMQLDGFSDIGGVELFLNDITGPDVLGSLIFLKPLSLIDRDNYVLRSFSIGGVLVTDIDAPLRNHVDVNDVDDDGRRETELVVDQDNFAPVYESTIVVAYGTSVEIKLIDTPTLDWKTYGDWSFLESGVPLDQTTFVGGEISTRAVRSEGAAWGHLFRINLGDELVHALRIRLEYRNHAPNYLPSYFDALYEVQRVRYGSGQEASPDDLANGTKLQQVLGRDPDGARVHGGYFETSWRVGDYFAMAFGLSANDSTPDDTLFVHLEVPYLAGWQFLATFQRTAADGADDLFAGSIGDNDVFIGKTRYNVFDWFALSLEALTPFGVGPESVLRRTVQVNLAAELGFAY